MQLAKSHEQKKIRHAGRVLPEVGGAEGAVGVGLPREGHDHQRREVDQAGEAAQDHHELAGSAGEGSEVETEAAWT